MSVSARIDNVTLEATTPRSARIDNVTLEAVTARSARIDNVTLEAVAARGARIDNVRLEAVTAVTNTANISGKVVESMLFGLVKRPSAGAKVSIDTIQTATTRTDGVYTLTDIPLGKYKVVVSKSYYETRTAEISLTEPGKTYTLDFEIPLSKWVNLGIVTAPIVIAGVAIAARPRKYF
jgi:hypothetical protein